MSLLSLKRLKEYLDDVNQFGLYLLELFRAPKERVFVLKSLNLRVYLLSWSYSKNIFNEDPWPVKNTSVFTMSLL